MSDGSSGAGPSSLLADLEAAVGGEALSTDPDAILRVLKDNSWLSPVLSEDLDRRREAEGSALGVLAVVAPRSTEQVLATAEVAVRHRIPVTPRGSGTSNFGLVTPARGGLVLDLRNMKGPCRLEGGALRAPAGVTQGEMERVARDAGRELTLLTTTYLSATVGGWVSGGHVGLGSSVHGSVWDSNVLEVTVATFEDVPASRVLRGERVTPLLHTFGTVGVLTEVVMRTDPAHRWLEAVASFPSFEHGAAFVSEVSLDCSYRHRVVTAQEAPLVPAFRPLSEVMGNGAGVLMIIDADQQAEVASAVADHDGAFTVWQEWQPRGGSRPSIAAMVYGHRMLWVKRLFPQAAFLHVYFDPTEPMLAVRALKERFGDDVLLEMKFVRSPWMLGVLGFDRGGSLPAAVVTVTNGSEGQALAEVMSFCRESGIPFQNPHTNVIEDTGMFPDVAAIVAAKAQNDPYNLLNPGKLRSAAVHAA